MLVLDFGAHWNHDGTKIVYVSDSAHRTVEDLENGQLPQYDIYVMNADGSNKKQLTFAKPGEVYADPSFSFTEPSKILYVYSNGSRNFDLYVMNADGSNKTLILKHNDEILSINDPMFSPDGSRIIFEARLDEDGNHGIPVYNIFSIKPDGSDLKRITQNDGETDLLPQYSPDGKKICYYTYKWENGQHTKRIRIANPDGSNEKVISEFPWETNPSWVPSCEKSNLEFNVYNTSFNVADYLTPCITRVYCSSNVY